MPQNMPCECSFYDKAVQPNDAGFLCPSCSQGFEWPQQCRRFPVALGPLASCFSFGKRTIYDPEAFHPGRPLLSQFWLFSLENFPSLPFPSNLAFSGSPSWPKFSLQLWISLRAFHSALLALDHSISRFCLAELCSPGSSLWSKSKADWQGFLSCCSMSLLISGYLSGYLDICGSIWKFK